MRVKLDDASEANLASLEERLKTDFPDAGWRIRTRDNAAPRLSENIGRFSQFLTLVALTALIVGGVGVGNAITGFLQTKTRTIATFKSLGAKSQTISQIYGLQLGMIALGAIGVGLALGAILPPLAGSALNSVLGIDAHFGVYGDKLALAAAYGLVITALFAIPPLAKSETVKAATLFRNGVSHETKTRLSPFWIGALVLGLCLFAALVLLFSPSRILAIVYVLAIGGGIVVLRLVAIGIMALAKRLPTPKNPLARQALRNLYRPQAPTPAIVLSLGLGLGLLVALAMIDVAISRQLTQNLPEKAPDFFFLDIPRNEQANFETAVRAEAPNAEINMVPMLRGRITAINGIRSEDYPAPPEARWVLGEDRGLTYTSELPEGTSITEGQWWDAETSENLVSFDDELARELGLKLGDQITVNVLGRDVTATLANFRAQEWESLQITFVMLFSPNAFKGAPHMMLSTVSLGDATASEQKVLSGVVTSIPTVTAIPVRDALEFANNIVKRLANAVRGASGLTLITSVLVLAGAFAAGTSMRAYDAVVMKTLGATRLTILKTLALEYLFLGLIAALFGLISGMAGAWAILTFVMETPFVFAVGVAAGLAVTAVLLTVAIGLVTTSSVLKAKPARLLRSL